MALVGVFLYYVVSLFLILNFTGYQNRKEPAVRLGERILDFTALDAEGKPFSVSSLHGRAFLLKFFRGHW